MKKFFLKLAIFALTLALPFGAYFYSVQAKPWVYGGSLMGSARVKYRMLQETEGARIIVAGGSNVPYAIECDMVEEAFGRPCLNIGATVNLGAEFYLQMMKGNLNEGDVVVLMPEFGMYAGRFGYTLVWMAVENDKEMFNAVPPSYWPGMVSNYYNYAKEKKYILETEGAPAQNLYAEYEAFGFGPRGDITTPRGIEMDEARSINDPLALNADLLDKGVVKAFNSFLRYAQKQGVQVYLYPAPFCRLAVTTGDEGAQQFEDALRRGCDIPLLGNIADGLWDFDMFYNSNNHLNSEGMHLYTEAFIAKLSEAGVQ